MERRAETIDVPGAPAPKASDPAANPTVIEAVRMAEGFLAGRGVGSPRLSAEHLLAKVMGCERLDLYLRFEERLGDEALDGYRALLRRRAEHYPLQYMLGSVEFYSAPFEIEEGVFIPRPETELLVEWIEELFEGRDEIAFIEFGVGSGVISGSLARSNPGWRGLAFDKSKRAADLSRRNFLSLGVSGRIGVFVAETFGAVGAGSRFDLLVANPPYIPSSAIPGLMKDVSLFEDHAALDGGRDGLGFYPHIAEAGARLLFPGGVIALEIGAGQGADVLKILECAGYERSEIRRDYNGLERLAAAFRPIR